MYPELRARLSTSEGSGADRTISAWVASTTVTLSTARSADAGFSGGLLGLLEIGFDGRRVERGSIGELDVIAQGEAQCGVGGVVGPLGRQVRGRFPVLVQAEQGVVHRLVVVILRARWRPSRRRRKTWEG